MTRWTGVYPRVCGGTPSAAPGPVNHKGLSPRVRGNLMAQNLSDAVTGSIPACAGEPWCLHATHGFEWVYPRVCGGTVESATLTPRYRGLSPRVRGNLGDADTVAVFKGSIPACAGEPAIHFTVWRRYGVYPRVCGGTTQARVLSIRVRGNPARALVARTRCGSIPACAGEPFTLTPASTARWVYPRVCGGTAARTDTALRTWGLSPRVRGNLLQLKY